MTERFQLRVALLSAEYPPTPGGLGDYTRRLGMELLGRGHRVFVLTVRDERFTIYDLGGPETSWRLSGAEATAPWGWRSWRHVITGLGATQPHVLHIQYQTGAYAMHPAINLLPWRLRGVRRSGAPPIVATAHDLLPPYLFPKAGPLREWVTRRLLADSDAAVVTNGEDYARLADDRRPTTDDRPQSARAGIGGLLRGERPAPGRLELIPIGSNIAVAPPAGYDRAAWRERLGVLPGETLVAFFGLISATKGLDTLLDALELLPPSARLLVIGGEAQAPQDHAYGAAVRERLQGSPLGARVRITGHCAEEEVSGHLLAADLLALPFTDGASFRRGSLLAALAHGAPVVTTSGQAVVGSDPSRLRDGENALLIAPRDARALAAAIERLAGDAGLRERLSESGRRLAALFGWPSIAERHEALYRRLLAAPPPFDGGS
jgi:polysaccharide biosynthesis protein PslF